MHPTQLSTQKREFIENPAKAFESKSNAGDPDKEKSALYSKIGQLQIENDVLKKVLVELVLPTNGKGLSDLVQD